MAGCSACQRRRKLLLAKLAAKEAKGKRVQAAAIGAVLAVTEAVGQAVNISGQSAHMPRLPESGSDRLGGKLIGEEDGNADSGTTDPADGSGGTDRGQSGGSGI